MSKGRSNKLAGQVAEHLVCAELGRRGYMATPFAGNVPIFDLLIADDDLRTVPIQVKCTRTGFWHCDAADYMQIDMDGDRQVERGITVPKHPNLVWAFVHLGDGDRHDRFYVMTSTQLHQVVRARYSDWMNGHGWIRPRSPDCTDNKIPLSPWCDEYEDAWDTVAVALSHG